MGGYYVPDIQRPGFGYQRRSEDDDEDGFASDWGGGGAAAPDQPATVSSSGTLASDTGVQAPDSASPVDPDAAAMQRLKWQDQMDLAPESVPGLPNVGGTPDPGPPPPAQAGQGAVQQQLATSYPPDATQMPVPDTLAVPPPFVGGAQPAAGPQRRDWTPPPVSSHPEEDRLKQMIKQGPKRSVLGTIAGMAAKGAAGWVNAGGRTRPVPIPTQTARDWALRAPGGGAWDTTLARQQQLAEQEVGEEKRAQTAQQIQAQEEERKAQADYYQHHGKYLDTMSGNAIQTEQDRQRDRQWANITRFIGKEGQVADLQPDGSLPPGKGWTKRNDPDHPGKFIAVRPSPGERITPEEGKRIGVLPDTDGNYYATPSMVSRANQTELGYAQAGQRAAQAETESLRRQLADKERGEYHQGLLSLGTTRDQDRADAKEQQRTDQLNKTLAAAEDEKNKRIVAADQRADAERAKLRQQFFKVPSEDEQRIQQQVRADKLIAYNQYAAISRQYGGRAWDAKGVDDDGNPIQGTEAYGKGETPVPYGTGGPTPAAPTISATPPAGGRGGRGGVPPPVKAASSQAGGQPPLPPPEAVKNMKPGVPTGFRNGQMWKKEADGSLTYLGQKKNN